MRKLVWYCELLMASGLQGYSPNTLDLTYLQTNLFLYMYIYNNIDNKNLIISITSGSKYCFSSTAS